MQTDVVIIGAGVAGSTLAIHLANQGKEVVLIERDWSMHHLIIGELLQPSGYACLQDMNLSHTVNDEMEAQKVHGYAMYKDDEKFVIEYDKKFQSPTGYGFRNGKFVQNLRGEAKSHSNITCVEANVKSLIYENDEVRGCTYIQESETKSVKAKLTVVCEGAFSMLRNELNEKKKVVNGHFLGIVLENGAFEHKLYGNLLIGKKHPAVMYPISPTEHRVLIDFKKAPRMGEKLKAQLREDFLPDVPKNLLPAFEKAIEKGEFQSMPNHRLAAQPTDTKGVLMIGDSLNMRHPLTGGGMTVAFHDVKFVGELLKGLDLNESTQLHEKILQFYRERSENIASINILADALYRVVKDEQLAEAVFGYLNRGGKYASEPLELLSGASKNKNMLLRHFSAVAVFGARKNMNSFSWKNVKSSNKMMRNAIHVISPLLMNEKPSIFQKIAIKSYAFFDRGVKL